MQDEFTPSAEINSAPAATTRIGRPKKKLTCDQCGNVFIPKLRTQRFCGRECQTKWFIPFIKQKASSRPLKNIGELQKSPLELQALLDTDDDVAWMLRAKYWEDETKAFSPKPTRYNSLDERRPLILTGHGVKLYVKRGNLVVRNGFTHYPQIEEEIVLFPGEWRLPSRIVLLDSNGSVSISVLEWLADKNIPLVMLDWQGKLITLLGLSEGHVDHKLRNAQRDAESNGVGLELASDLIRQKIIGSKRNILKLPHSPLRDKVIGKIDRYLEELNQSSLDINSIRLIEARAALAYFNFWQSLPIKWKSKGQQQIPMEWLMVGQRESLLSGTNRNATHPINAILNYAYGVLESQIRIMAQAVGLDLTIGYLHVSRTGRMALVYDLMEPLRPKVEQLILDLVTAKAFYPADFILSTSGICRLHPQLAKRIASLSVSDSEVLEVVESVKAFLTKYSNGGGMQYTE